MKSHFLPDSTYSELDEQDNIYGITPIGSRLTGKREMSFGGTDFRQCHTPAPAPIKTPKEIEKDLLDSIEKHVRLIAFNNRYIPRKINSELKGYFGKPRGEMTIPELENVLSYIQQAYPLSHRRERGRRVSTAVERWVG